MARDTFPSPKYNTIIEPNSDKQIISVPLEVVDWGSRKVSHQPAQSDMPSSVMKLKHVKSE